MRRNRHDEIRLISTFFLIILISTLFGCGEQTYYDKKLGIEVQAIDPDLQSRWGVEGVVISKVDPSGPADKAGLERGEMIKKISVTTEVNNGRQCKKAINEGIKNEKMVIVNTDDGKSVLIAVKNARDDIGVTFSGTTVTAIDEGTPVALTGLAPNDQVVSVTIVRSIKTLDDYKKIVKKLSRFSNELTVHTAELSGIKLAAIRALGEIGGADEIDLLIDIMESGEELFREPAAKALEKLASSYSSPRLIQKMIEHLRLDRESNPEIRASCAIILGELKPVEAIGALITGLYDPVANVRFKSGVALSEIGEPAVKPLIEEFRRTTDPNVQDIIASTLGEIGTTEARDALISSFDRIESSSAKLSILDALSGIGDTKSMSFLTAVANSGIDPKVKIFLNTLLAEAQP